MPDFGKIQWEVKVTQDDKNKGDIGDSFDFFLNYCKAKLPSQNLTISFDAFAKERKKLQEQLKLSIESLSQLPLLTAFLAWIKEISTVSKIDLGLIKILLDAGFIGTTDKEGQVWTIAKAKDFNHQNVLDAIRCRYDWSTELRENLVMAYTNFIQWLSGLTFGYIREVEDPDLLRSNARAFPYAMFLKFINFLKDKDRLVAKLLYFGGNRNLEEILNLKIEDINLANKIIYFDSLPVTYPLHIFADANSIIKDRKKGKVFLGRQNAPMSITTIFRNFKNAAQLCNLGENFTPKLLVINK